jgi:hypothetical protein
MGVVLHCIGESVPDVRTHLAIKEKLETNDQADRKDLHEGGRRAGSRRRTSAMLDRGRVGFGENLGRRPVGTDNFR